MELQNLTEISGEEFYNLLKSNQEDISDYKIQLDESLTIDLAEIISTNTISNCFFSGKLLKFIDTVYKKNINNTNYENRDTYLTFDNCRFYNSKTHMQECYFTNLELIDSYSDLKNSLTMFGNRIDYFYVRNFLSNNFFNIKSNTFDFLEIRDLIVDRFWCIKNNFLDFIMHNSKINDLNFFDNDLEQDCKLNHITITNSCSFNNCNFNETRFLTLILEKNISLERCSFKKNTIFKLDGESYFENCTFEDKVHFFGKDFSHLNIQHSIFKDFPSFQNISVNSIEITYTIFEKSAYFDNITIKNIKNCSRDTLRIIKQQLQKTENRIEYNKFRIYELEAYKRENKNISLSDHFILCLHKRVSNHGTEWLTALRFILMAGLIFYTIFFICQNYNCNYTISQNYELNFNIKEWKSFLTGYFRFLLVTDFYNPLEEGKTYIGKDYPLSWTIFIFGKVFIAFGIYELIQSFRKFRA